jgi:hypothetical protein
MQLSCPDLSVGIPGVKANPGSFSNQINTHNTMRSKCGLSRIGGLCLGPYYVAKPDPVPTWPYSWISSNFEIIFNSEYEILHRASDQRENPVKL